VTSFDDVRTRDDDRCPTLTPAPPTPDSKDRHGLGWVLSWTVAGTLAPGAGLIAAGRRRSGIAVLATCCVVLTIGVVWVLADGGLERGISLALDPHRLLLAAIAAVVLGVLWAALTVLNAVVLHRRADLGRSPGLVVGVLVLALLVGIGLPTAAVADAALVQRDLVSTVFAATDSTSGGNGAGLATPNVVADDDQAEDDAEPVDPWAATDRVNVLLIGSDAGTNREGLRPDTLIVASIQPASGNTVLFSLPRNLEHVPFRSGTPGAQAWPDGYYCANDECMINAIWSWAENSSAYADFDNPGLRATEDAVTGVTGLDIDTYMMLNLQGFRDFIDAIGGITVSVDERLPIGGNSENPDETFGYIEAGPNQTMNGKEALWYARSRWSTDDYDRMRRQRCVIAAVTEQADPVTLARHFTSIAKALKANMSTGIPQSDLAAWVELAGRIQAATVTSLPFTDDVLHSRVDPDYDMIHEKVATAIEESEQDAEPSAADGTGTDAASAPIAPPGVAPQATGTTGQQNATGPADADGQQKNSDDGGTDEPSAGQDAGTAQDVTEVC